MCRNCTVCEGTGVRRYSWETTDRVCYACDGKKTFAPLDVDSILAAIVGTRGKSKGKLLSSRPDRKKGGRAYFVWRLARFHGGADVCMPCMADVEVAGDPYKPELNLLAEAVAKRAFGTEMAAAFRWGRALGMVQSVPAGLPMSAYEGGPAGTDIRGLADSPEFHTDRYEAAVEAGDTETVEDYTGLPLFASVA
jgi:hypothetical protein